ncbi:MAG: ankyrin repeat domain-containing protein [Planctomycetota bacterium]
MSSINDGETLHDLAEKGVLDAKAVKRYPGDIDMVRRTDMYTPLNIAVEFNDVKAVELLLKYGASVQRGIVYNLRHAIENNQVAVARRLLKAGADPEYVDVTSKLEDPDVTMLMLASSLGNKQMVSLLLEHGADIKRVDSSGKNALDYASSKSGFREFLLDHGAVTPNKAKGKKKKRRYLARDRNRYKEAAQNRDDKTALAIVEDGLIDVNIDWDNCFFPLGDSVGFGLPSTTRKLLELGANPNVGPETFIYPLVTSSFRGLLDITADLCDFGAKLDVFDFSKESTPLGIAIQRGHIDVAKFLVEKGAAVDVVTKNGRSALDLLKEQSGAGAAELRELIGQ